MSILPSIFRKPLMGLSLVTALAFGTTSHAADGNGGTSAKKLPEPEFTVQVEMPKGSNEGTLTISAKIPISPKTRKPYHIYSTRTNGVNGGRATKVTFEKGVPWELLGSDFTADHEPHATTEPDVDDKPEPVEHFERKVTWKRQIRLKTGVAPQAAPVAGTIRCQMCDESSCRFIRHRFKTQVSISE